MTGEFSRPSTLSGCGQVPGQVPDGKQGDDRVGHASGNLNLHMLPR